MADETDTRPLIDWVAVAVSPVLVMGMVGSLVFFLIEVLYQGQYSDRLLYTMFFFLVDGPGMRTSILDYLPLDNDEKELLTERFLSITRQTMLYRMKKYGFASPTNPEMAAGCQTRRRASERARAILS